MGEIDPFELLEEVPEGLEEALVDPDGYNFRPESYDQEILYPDHMSVRVSVVDLENDNVQIRYNTQVGREKYTAVLMEDEFTLVESTATVTIDNVSSESDLYYLVTDEDVFLHEGRKFSESKNTAVKEVAELSEKFYQQALEERKEQSQSQADEEFSGPDPVPPPENDEMFPE
ncbi:hypothetical protein ACK3SF_02760 [Candidatus Nanosalina sp. VS9-1]|uniref:hypothetical protein n=1 Tax=Candidatus Nanosalina sp. VS9-1 TaxID=3388566 RepID=UPI0039E00D4E